MTIKIRLATDTLEDRDQINRMTMAACEHSGMPYVPVPSSRVILAEQDGTVCGMVEPHRISEDLTQIAHLWVDERYRNNGIGTALLNSVSSKEIVLLVSKTNAAAIRLYQRNGFVEGELINLRKVRECS